ncbi:MAG TPA: DUF4266 domain-containing protein [Polyangia bacterium]
MPALLGRRLRLGFFLCLSALGPVGCLHSPPVKPWQREHLSKRAMSFDDGLEGRFKQHVHAAREGAEGGYGHVGGGCGCN